MAVLNTSGTSPSGTRRIAFRVCLVLSGLFYAVLLTGLSALLSPAWSEPIHRVHHVGAALFIGMIAVGLLAQLRAPERNIAAFWQVVVAVLAIQITNFIIGDPDNYGGNAGIMDPAFLIFVVPLLILAVLHPARGRLLRAGTGMSPALTGISLVAAVPLAVYGVNQALVQRNSWPPLADPHHQKWFMMAFLAFALPLLGLVASFRLDGWRVPAWSAGITAGTFGLVSVLYPTLPSSVGQMWGSISVLGGVAVIGATMWKGGRDLVTSVVPHGRRNTQEGNKVS